MLLKIVLFMHVDTKQALYKRHKRWYWAETVAEI